ncbi:DUF1622 domain-containing protein [Archangium violaceum]|uniref:DUF1622 domain-containing protein n=1 Tax=Archangium violaceum Cb vi76 TaxID=1406225 RepID=A0A084SFE3_9BACT|nr:DUF1622 domain-containing protein [Archangium violaceum]KFA87178.1 hypothetical protein Q664_49505 [Archangium violaceum Cb vi76]
MDFTAWIALSARLFEGAGVAVMVVGTLVSIVLVLAHYRRGGGEQAFRSFREKVGRAILLGLELLVAADIIRTVSEEPTLRGVIVLGLIVLIRTFLSFTLAVELEGHWPWKSAELRGVQQQGRLTPSGAQPPSGQEARTSEPRPPQEP